MRKCAYCDGGCDWSRCECACHDGDDVDYELWKDRKIEDGDWP